MSNALHTKMLLLVLPIIIALAFFLFIGVPVHAAPKSSSTDRHIVVFKDGVSDTKRDETLGKVHGTHIKRLSKAAHADVVSGLTDAEVQTLATDPSVERVEKDELVTTLAKRSDVTTQSIQTLQWNIDRIDAEKVWPLPLADTGALVKVAVIDTGISTSHPDLVANIKGGINTINPWRSYNDDNGHGSHVAGIIAAPNNTTGVIGVAPQASLYAVKVLDSRGSGYLSDIIEGLDWSIANHMQVANMSLGTTADIQSFHDAITRAYNAGIVLVAAAGNDGGAVNYPGAYPEVIAVAGTDQYDAVPYWSSRGLQVALAAPGVSVYSTYKNQTYATLSGTSMATPHVTGVVALLLKVPQKCDTNLNGVCSPSEVKARLQATAEDKGAVGFDSIYGAGIVNAYAAITN